MAAADVVMGKAGPNMLFESVTLGKPFIATNYIPGQEEINLELIRRHQLGWVALTAEDQRNLIQSLSSNAAALIAVRTTADSYRRWNTEATAQIRAITQSITREPPTESSRERRGEDLSPGGGLRLHRPRPKH